MNEDTMKGKWNEMKGEAKKRWGKLTDDDLTAVSGEKDRLVGILQQKYGYSKEEAEKEYNSFMEEKK